jgi:uncharacterized membrane protein YraQ (UPF0718 family)
MAFWIASPILDPEMFILTSAGVGLPFAIFKALSAVTMGLMAGSSVLLLQKFNYLSNGTVLKSMGGSSSCAVPLANNVPPPITGNFGKNLRDARCL